jgi:hypothetical protein
MATTKNLGLVAAMQAGLTPPTNTKLLWYNENIGENRHYYYDVVASQWVPLVGSGGGGGGGADLSFNGNRAITRQIPSVYGVNVGTTTIPDFLEKVFFVAENPLLSLSIAGGNVRRFGENPAVTLNWNVIKKTLGISAIVVDTSSVTPSSNIDGNGDTSGNSQSGSKSGAATQNVNTTFNMSVTDTASNTFTTSTQLVWENENFWWTGSSDLIGSSAGTLSTLLNGGTLNHAFATGRQQTRSFSPVGEFIYFAWPAAYGANPLTDFVMNGLPQTAWQTQTFTFTNNAATPYAVSYILVRSQNVLNANFTVTVV